MKAFSPLTLHLCTITLSNIGNALEAVNVIGYSSNESIDLIVMSAIALFPTTNRNVKHNIYHSECVYGQK